MRKAGRGSQEHLNWMPDLIVKLAAIFTVLHHGDKALPTNLLVAEDGLHVVIACLARPLLAGCLDSWAKVVSEPSVKLATDTHGATDNEGRILKKITETPGITRRELQRSFDSMSSGGRDAALDTLITRGLVRVEGNSLFVC